MNILNSFLTLEFDGDDDECSLTSLFGVLTRTGSPDWVTVANLDDGTSEVDDSDSVTVIVPNVRI